MISRIAQKPPSLPLPTLGVVARGFQAAVRRSSHAGRLEREVSLLFPDTPVVSFATGRAALASAIRIALRVTGRRRVVLPAYTSYSVAAAAAAADARVCLCDLDPTTLDFDRDDLRKCVDGDTAAVVLGNLFGYPSRVDDLGWLRDRGVIVIDDAAQAVGALDRGLPVGGRGDLGILSFGRGKCVSTGDGGVLLVQRADLQPLPAERRPAQSRGLRLCLMALAIWLSRSSIAFGLLSRVPGANIGASIYDPHFELRALPPSADGLAFNLAEAVRRHQDTRARVARMWMTALRGNRVVTWPASDSSTRPAYLRLPLFASDAETRERLVACLSETGFRFVRSYPTALGGIKQFRHAHCEDRATPAADGIADKLIALPCHAGVTPRDIGRAVRVLHDPEVSRLGSTRPASLRTVG